MIWALLVLCQDAARIAQEVDYANSKDRPQFQPQAVKRLKERGAAAVAEPLLDFVRKNGRNALSLACTELLGSLKDERITKLLHELVSDKEFTWRPTAMRALAEHGDRRYLEEFRAGLSDRLWGCRAATVYALEKIGDRESIPKIRELLGDEVYEVRAQAAKTLHAFGDTSGLPVLVEALRSDSVWFEIDYGQIAREDAWNFLKKVAGDDYGYKPWESPAERAPGLAKFEAWIARTIPDWRERVPGKARVRAEKTEYVFGYELRSCQKGDFFFRIDREGNFVLGYFNLEAAKLTGEERKALEGALEKVKAISRVLPYGQGGCDYEQYFIRAGPRFEKLWIGLKGRPLEAEPFVRAVHGIVKSKFGEKAAQDFRESSLLFRGEE